MLSPSLVVTSDNSEYLDVIKELLMGAGYLRVRCCIQRLAVFDLVQREQPDLVLLDVSMGHPGAGWRILDLLRLHPATTHIPILLCITDPRMVSAKEAMLADMRCAMLEKPFDLDTLLSKIRTLVGSHLRQTTMSPERSA
jgi:CheY-like chemotaxis protein